MKEIKRKWDRITNEKRKSSIEEIITFFKQERDEKIGVIAAEEILDFFLQTVGGDVYNKGVKDSKEALEKRTEDLKIDLDILLD